MFQGTQEARDQGWSIRSVSVADPDGPRRAEQTIRLLLRLSTAKSGAEAEPADAQGHDLQARHVFIDEGVFGGSPGSTRSGSIT